MEMSRSCLQSDLIMGHLGYMGHFWALVLLRLVFQWQWASFLALVFFNLRLQTRPSWAEYVGQFMDWSAGELRFVTVLAWVLCPWAVNHPTSRGLHIMMSWFGACNVAGTGRLVAYGA